LGQHVGAKLAELRETIAVRRGGSMAGALAAVATDRGKAEMDAIRAQLAVMTQEELRLRQIRLDDMQAASAAAVATAIITSAIGIALTIVIFLLLRRDQRLRARQQWLQAGQLGLAAAMRGEKSVEEIGEAILAFLARYLGFQAGAVFKGEDGHFSKVATLGVASEAEVPNSFGLKQGLLGRVAAEGEPLVVDEVPQGYLTIGSALGSEKPRQLVIVPAKADDAVNAVVELGFFHTPDP
ncbi:MAG: CHASE3 domain-containing protein, partial [Caulobacter sp.]|nr:CHASE3 domain-containing protein [Caulobacter sp.]